MAWSSVQRFLVIATGRGVHEDTLSNLAPSGEAICFFGKQMKKSPFILMTVPAVPMKAFPQGTPLAQPWGFLEEAWNTLNIKNIFSWLQIPAEIAYGVFPTPLMAIGEFRVDLSYERSVLSCSGGGSHFIHFIGFEWM